MGVEVLIPDFNGAPEPLRTVIEARPDILNHNVETVARLQKPVRKRPPPTEMDVPHVHFGSSPEMSTSPRRGDSRER